MTARRSPRVSTARLARGVAALSLALLATLAGVASARADSSAHHGHAHHGAGVSPAMGRPPVPPDEPAGVPHIERVGAEPARPPVAVVSGCPDSDAGDGSSIRTTARRPDHPPGEAGCAAPAPAATPPPRVAPVLPPLTAAPATAAPRATPPSVLALATGVPAPRAPEALPVPPPLELLPAVLPSPVRAAAPAAPTSVLILGFGSVALASTAIGLRLVRRGR